MRTYALATATLSLAVWLVVFAAGTYFAHMHILSAVIAANLAVAVVCILLAMRNITTL